jgi:hypothetical protein
MPDADVVAISRDLARAISHAHGAPGGSARVVMSNAARDHWANVYGELTQDYPGILGAVTSRAEAQALRLSMTYALFAGSDRIELEHVEAGLAFWRYAFDSASHIFGRAEIDPVAQRIVEALSTGPKSQTEIVNLFGRNLNKKRIEAVFADLQVRGRITLSIENTRGRPRRVWRLAL